MQAMNNLLCVDFRTEIEWNAGKNLTQKVLKKKPKKGAKNTKPVTKTEQCESFFNFFSPPQVPDDDDIDQDTVWFPWSASLWCCPSLFGLLLLLLLSFFESLGLERVAVVVEVTESS